MCPMEGSGPPGPGGQILGTARFWPPFGQTIPKSMKKASKFKPAGAQFLEETKLPRLEP